MSNNVDTDYVYAIYDKPAESFSSPFVCKTDGIAIRDFKSVVNNPKSSVGMYPNDYSLYRIGKYCSLSGKLFSCDFNLDYPLAKGIDFVENKSDEVK